MGGWTPLRVCLPRPAVRCLGRSCDLTAENSEPFAVPSYLQSARSWEAAVEAFPGSGTRTGQWPLSGIPPVNVGGPTLRLISARARCRDRETCGRLPLHSAGAIPALPEIERVGSAALGGSGATLARLEAPDFPFPLHPRHISSGPRFQSVHQRPPALRIFRRCPPGQRVPIRPAREA